MVLSSDRPPKAMAQLERRLQSRFEWGLIADIQPPDLETRLAILQDKAEALSVHISADVLDMVAYYIRSNIRELEGALNKVVAYSQLTGAEPSVQLAEMALAGRRGVDLEAAPDGIAKHAVWFGEDQARYVVAATEDKVDTIKDVAAIYDVAVRVLGTVGDDKVTLPGEAPLPLGMLRAAYEDWLPRYMARG